MQHFYVESDAVSDGTLTISGSDYNHIKNVLRMKPGEELTAVDGESREYLCEVSSYDDKRVLCTIKESRMCALELPCKVVLFQGLPKKDKLELIVQKAVELGVSKIVPVLTKRAVVVPGSVEKESKKTERLNAIALAAAKQCGRGVVPEVSPLVSFGDALKEASGMDIALIPYELADDVESSRAIIRSLGTKKSVAVFIGPEGGFDRTEVEAALEAKVIPITLGKRILRTETAAICALSLIMYETTS
ncbi:MAG: 16S rRNA (uracil(1498)-N(3))-methyltransferase [Lachnospiraceae bacterium]|nr:16S rRNA (uracil(1498)-N(3))-methyltransferase [Lachnospiraceae bacterium]